jgi:hypothetical protein
MHINGLAYNFAKIMWSIMDGFGISIKEYDNLYP